LCYTYTPNFIFCNETWLHEAIPDSLIEIKNYNFIRKDRKNKKGGGICVYFKEEIKINIFALNGISENFEHTCFEHNKIIYVFLYLAPWLKSQEIMDSFDYIIEQLDQLQTNFPYSQLCVLGDFNKTPTQMLSHSLNIVNIVNEATRLNSILDCCFVSKETASDFKCIVGPPLGKSDHNCVHIFHNENISSCPKNTMSSTTFVNPTSTISISKLKIQIGQIFIS